MGLAAGADGIQGLCGADEVVAGAGSSAGVSCGADTGRGRWLPMLATSISAAGSSADGHGGSSRSVPRLDQAILSSSARGPRGSCEGSSGEAGRWQIT